MNRILTIFMLLGIYTSILSAQDTVKGRASYYSDQLHGRRMSNGERYNKDSLTCAHLKYPFGTLLRVRNLRNGKEVIVKVTDRGPHSKRFTIDLSKAAARKLDMIRSGHVAVEITPYKAVLKPYKLKDGKDIPHLQLNNRPWIKDSLKTVAGDSIPAPRPRPADTLKRDTAHRQKHSNQSYSNKTSTKES
ncbi:MAG: septal ring lytic transglycosylase RlpA family protein [Paraprevotella sp.]|nr:septal ring lytic transglycosylase RlpA family protein [Paraprevotella sp.]